VYSKITTDKHSIKEIIVERNIGLTQKRRREDLDDSDKQDCSELRFQNLLVARTLFEASQRVFCVHVLNISDKCIRLRSNTPTAMLSAVTIPTAEKHDKNETCTEDISVAEMRAALEAKGVKFTDVALTGTDFENLVKLLYKYIDQMAANLNDLGECNLIPLRINTGDALAVIQKPFRHSPEQKALLRLYIDI
jgi:hypothetical protein